MTVYTTDGALMQREVTPGGGTFATIPQCMNIDMPEWKRKSVEVPIHDQVTPVKKYGSGESQGCSFDLAWDPANAYHQQLFADWTAKTERNYRVILPDAGSAQFQFAATIEEIKPESLDAEGNPLKLSITMGLAAAPTITW